MLLIIKWLGEALIQLISHLVSRCPCYCKAVSDPIHFLLWADGRTDVRFASELREQLTNCRWHEVSPAPILGQFPQGTVNIIQRRPVKEIFLTQHHSVYFLFLCFILSFTLFFLPSPTLFSGIAFSIVFLHLCFFYFFRELGISLLRLLQMPSQSSRTHYCTLRLY
jgi:hypothetical protein